MNTLHGHGHPILILGAGRGGSAMLETFVHEDVVRIVGICDTEPDAPGLALARRHGIPTFSDAEQALRACAPCLALNLTHNDALTELAVRFVGAERVLGGEEAKIVWLIVTRLKRTRDALEKSQQELQSIIQTAIDGIITFNEQGNIVSFNPAAEHIFGYSKSEIIGKSATWLIPEADLRRFEEDIRAYMGAGTSQIIGAGSREVVARRKDGSTFPMEISANEMRLPDGRYLVAIVRDISERKKAEEKIRQMAHYDQLTGLANRHLLYDRIKQALANSRRHGTPMALLLLDLDGFKPVNDTYGHDVGDLLLREVAQRLKGCVREVDTVARVGGDEFVIVLTEIGSRGHAAVAAKKILSALEQPYTLADRACQVSGSIGVAMAPDDGTNIDTLLKHADDAMYKAKQSGKHTYVFYAADGDAR